jgi:hypothetical protein
LSLTALVVLTYTSSHRKHLINSIKTRRWREVFTGLE